jgi:hypothetical protein
MFCPDCGNALSSETAKFCFKCGGQVPVFPGSAPLETASTSAPSSQPAGPPLPGPAFSFEQPPAKKQQSTAAKVIGVVLALVAGLVSFVVVRNVVGGGGAGPSLAEFTAGSAVVPFSDPNGRFTVAMPKGPQEQRQSIAAPDGGQIDVVMYVAEKGDEYAFGAGYVDAGGRPIDLQGAVRGAAANVGGTIQSQTPRAISTMQGIQFHMTAAGEPITAWVGTSGSTMYHLLAGGMAPADPSIETFFNSFTLTAPG